MIKNLASGDKTAPKTISRDQETISVITSKNKPQWQRELANAIRSADLLCERLGLKAIGSDATTTQAKASGAEAGMTQKDGDEASLSAVLEQFPVLVPESFLKRMTPQNPRDPLLLQVLPSFHELDKAVGYSFDPVGDRQSVFAPGILQKYPGRALMITVGQCAVHCRYCFRRNYPYHQSPRSLEQWGPSLDKLRQNRQIEEIILSGGDPLVLSDQRLAKLIGQLDAINHLKRIRVHTRLPIVLPSRVTEGLLDLFRHSRLQPIFVVHANHPNEIVDDCAEAIVRMVRAGIPVLNQAVLLKGINDTTGTQAELCRRLINLGAIPYYLHQLDRIEGAAHFETGVALGKKIIEELKQQLPGYAVPKYVREIPGEPGKTELT